MGDDHLGKFENFKTIGKILSFDNLKRSQWSGEVNGRESDDQYFVEI